MVIPDACYSAVTILCWTVGSSLRMRHTAAKPKQNAHNGGKKQGASCMNTVMKLLCCGFWMPMRRQEKLTAMQCTDQVLRLQATRHYFVQHYHERDLCLPATTLCHIGDNATWTAPDGASMHCIDHIAIPHQWLPRCTHSQVLADFDLAQRHEDHRAVTLQLQWDARIQQYKHKKHKKAGVNIDYKDPIIKEGLIKYQPESWEVDVEQQAGQLVQHLQQSMCSLRTQQVVCAKKAYVTPEVWQLRTQKLQCRQIIKENQT